ncbi:hypothetical protein [Qipengyuania sp. RANM35]|uniref:hypothetical protein n=1 Tax=Qipengyuania sp. RANM35 TaxID=3068635 RepID=UPI0034DB795F
MSDRRARMIEDRYLRDSAKALVEADLEHLKTGLSKRGLTERAFDKVREGAVDIYEEAVEVAEDNKGALAALIAAVVVWFARNPILSLLGLGEEPDDAAAERDEAEER